VKEGEGSKQPATRRFDKKYRDGNQEEKKNRRALFCDLKLNGFGDIFSRRLPTVY